MAISAEERTVIEGYIATYEPTFLQNATLAFLESDAALTTSRDYFGELWPKAVALKVCHAITLKNLFGTTGMGAGMIDTKTIGPVTIKYSNKVEKGTGTYSRTLYGQMYLELRGSLGTGISGTGVM